MNKKQIMKEFDITYDLLFGTPRPKGYEKKELKKHFDKALDDYALSRLEELKVGNLRQYLNENPKMPITNEAIEVFLHLDKLKQGIKENR